MSEQLPTQPDIGEPQVNAQDTQESYAGRLRRKLGEAGRDMYSLLDVSAGVAVVASDIKLAHASMDRIDQQHGGLIERQTAPDTISLELQDDFRVQAQAAGYTDVEAMPGDMRRAIAETVAYRHMAEIITELQMRHLDWAPEELAEAAEVRANDIATLLAMGADEQAAYRADVFEYQEVAASLPEMQAQLDELREQRNNQLSQIGRAALKSLVSFAGKVRALPLTVASKATVGVMSAVDWYRESSAERKKTIRFTAVSIAVTGIAAFIASRVSGMAHMPDMIPAADYTTDHTNLAPDISVDYGSGGSPHISGEYGAVDTPHMSVEYGQVTDPDIPVEYGQGNEPDIAVEYGQGGGEPSISTEYGQSGEVPGVPVEYGATGIDLSGATTSEQLFGHTDAVSSWPDTVTVGKWNPNTEDGSLWGISRQLLHGSGVKNPSDGQVQQLVDALRPQAAGSNGWLDEGQQLDLTPALKLLPSISN